MKKINIRKCDEALKPSNLILKSILLKKKMVYPFVTFSKFIFDRKNNVHNIQS